MVDPIELLSGKYEQSVISKIYNPVIGGVLGFSAMVFVNWGTRRPLLSGLQKHILAAGLGATIGKVVDDYRNTYLAERDAVYKHYIELHREDFPVPERKKFADVLLPWIPIR